MRTSAPEPVAFASPPGGPAIMPMSTWITYKTQIQFGFAILAYLMVLVGSITVVQANPAASWKYGVAVLPVIPAGLVIFFTVRGLGGVGEGEKRSPKQALGGSIAA